MEEKSGVSGESLILGFTSWIWLVPFSCAYSKRTVDELFGGLVTASIPSGAVLLAFLTLLTAVLGVIGEKLSFVFVEKALLGPTSNPRHYYARQVGSLNTEDWHSAQERIWSSAQAFREFTSAKLGQMVGRTLAMNAGIALIVLGYAYFMGSWLRHFYLLLWIAWLALALGMLAWWISTGYYLAIVRVAGEMEKRKVATRRLAKRG